MSSRGPLIAQAFMIGAIVTVIGVVLMAVGVGWAGGAADSGAAGYLIRASPCASG
jgi:xanthine/uracil permease